MKIKSSTNGTAERGRYLRKNLRTFALYLGIIGLAGIVAMAYFTRAATVTGILATQSGSLDSSFGNGGKVFTSFGGFADGSADAVAIQSDGKTVAIGEADGGNDDNIVIVRYNIDGSLDNSFGGDGVVITRVGVDDADIDAVAIQTDGKIVAAGSAFTGTFDGFAVVRYNTDGSLDTSFGSAGIVFTQAGTSNSYASSVIVQSDGRIVVGGSGNDAGENYFALVRYNADGSLDVSFDGDGRLSTTFQIFGSNCADVLIQPDGKIIATGTTFAESGSLIALARYNSDGSLDTTFDTDGKVETLVGASAYAISVAIQSDGKVVVAGQSSDGQNDGDFTLVRYNTNGSLDTSFDLDGKATTSFSTGFDSATDLKIQSDGRIVAAGRASFEAEGEDFAIARYNTNGSLDTAFDGDGKLTLTFNAFDYFAAAALQSDGRIIVFGDTSPANSPAVFALVRLNTNGSLDTSFSEDGIITMPVGTGPSEMRSIAIQPDGKIIAAGSSDGNPNTQFAIARYNTNGTLDTSFGVGGKVNTDFGQYGVARSVAIQSDGKIVAAGEAFDGTNSVFALARYDANGSLDLSFSGDGKVMTSFGGPGDHGNSVTLQSDGKIVAAGITFTGVANGIDFALARYNTDGSLDSSFDGDGLVSTSISAQSEEARSVAIQADGKIVAAGYANNGTDDDFAVARYDPNGSLDTSFGGDGSVTTQFTVGHDGANGVKIQSDGRIVAVGYTVIAGGDPEFALARYNTDGSLDTLFDGDGKVTTLGVDEASSVAIQTDGKIIAAGTSSINSFTGSFGLARYNTNGALDASFGSDGKVITAVGPGYSSAYSVAIQSDGKIIAGGQGYDAESSNFALVRYGGTGSLDVTNTNDSGAGSLRQAIIDANSNPDASTISFNIPGGGPYTINLLSGLPNIDTTMTIDASTQPGFTGPPLIELNGAGAGDSSGFRINSNTCVIKGFVINRFNQHGIFIAGSNTTVQGNYIGTNVAGTSALPNLIHGVALSGVAGSTIGGTSANTRNVVSGNASIGIDLLNSTGNQVIGNYIGTNAAGTSAVPNNGIGIAITLSPNNTIGGTASGAGNVISGNVREGIAIRGITASGNQVLGNFVGTTASGLTVLGNQSQGIFIFESPNNLIGGTAPGARNIISGNRFANIGITRPTATGNSVIGNYIGTDATGLAGLVTPGAGVVVGDAGSNIIGGTSTNARNIISGNSGAGVEINTNASNNQIFGNFIGTDVNGAVAIPNQNGISLNSSSGNTVGGITVGVRNVISGNSGNGIFIDNASSNNSVKGNFIGTNTAGNAAIGNAGNGVHIFDSSDNVVGGTESGARNIIAGSPFQGVNIQRSSLRNKVQGNFIGTDLTGNFALANGSAVIIFEGASNNLIGGTEPGAGNVLSGSTAQGIYIGFVGTGGPIGTSINNVVQGNLIGTNASGTASVSNSNGIVIDKTPGTVIGGSTPQARNIISGNRSNGIFLFGTESVDNVIRGNFIGTNQSGTGSLPNAGSGVSISGSSNNDIGGISASDGNIIAFNSVGVTVPSGTGNSILMNSIFSNGTGIGNLGINLGATAVTPNDAGDADTGANNQQNFPVLTSAANAGGNTTIQGSLNSLPVTEYRVELFNNSACDAGGNGEGQNFIGSVNVTTDGAGNAAINTAVAALPNGSFITSTATRLSDGIPVETSEFSECLAFPAISLKADYQFQGNLDSTVAGAPAMTNLTGSGANSFVPDTIDGYSRQSLRFPFNSGVSVNTAGLIPNNSYTVVFLFKFDEVSGFRRGLDVKNRTSDGGGYIHNGRLEFESPPGPLIDPNSYIQIAAVRDQSGGLRVYRDGILRVNLVDANNDFEISPANIMSFFQDDLVEPNEASAGNVARIRLFDGPLTTVQIQALDRVPEGTAVGQQDIVFVSSRDGNTEIYTMNPDGSEQRRLTNNAFSEFQPSWSPDGSKIAFSSFRDGNSEIYTMNADGSNQMRITNNTLSDQQPHWSPDGTRFVFTCSRGNPVVQQLCLINSDGTGETQLTNGSQFSSQPKWSPNGAQITFISDRLQPSNVDVYVMDANGANIVRLTTPAGDDAQPDWSPDGTQIVFTSFRDANFELYKMSADGANQTRLTDFPIGGGFGDDAQPSYSPDGTKIAFTRGLNGNGNFEIFTMNADGTNPQRLTNQPGTEQQADWRGQGGGGGSECSSIGISVGNSVNGTLGTCEVNGNPTDFYNFVGTLGQQIVVSLDSLGAGGIQPSLQLIAPDGETILAQSSGSTNARIPAAGVFTLPSAGVYAIRVSTLDNVGAYTLSLVQPPANTTCVYAPSPTNTNVAPSGVPASGGTSFFFDVLTQDGCPSASASVGAGSEHISIVSNSGGRVTFSVSPHSGQAERVGTILAGERVHTVTQFGVTPPANDTFLQAQTLPSTSGSIPGRNTDAAAEGGEPQHLQGEAANRSVWYKWTAPSEGGRYSFTTSGSDFDTVMAIYTGTSVGGLTRIAGNDDTTSFDLTSKVNFFSTGGTTYYIAVDGKSGASGSIQLSYSPFRRLFRLYLQNFNGTASPISPSSVTTRREDGTGQTITGDFISLGVYEFDLPEDNAFYIVTIDGPAGITWSPPTYRINNSSSAFNPLMMNLQGGDGGTGQNQISNATNTIPRKFKGFVHGISSSADLALFSVHIGSTGTTSAVAPVNCSNPPFTTPPHLVTGGPGGSMRVQYECETQPNTTHQILPSAPGKAFVVPALPLQVLNTDSGPFDANAITAVNSATYSIGGRITANGQGLGGATVDISSGIISIRTTSSGNGDYVFPDLAPGLTYMVKATRGGFVFQPQPVTLQSSNVTLNITAQTCAFTLSGFGQFEEDGGLGQIGVTAAAGQTCEWTAERGANSEWININSGGGLGSGQVQFTVQSNNGAARTGTIIAGGQVFTVSQFSRINVVQPFSTRFDFDGDRNADLSVYRPSNNLWYVRRSTAGYMTADYAGAQGDFMAPADYDGDRKADIAFFRPSNGTWYIFSSATQTLSTFGWGQSGDIPAPADHDGDRKADLVVFRPSTGTWFRKLSLDDSLSATFFGTNGDKPVIGDFDGDGKDDIALYRVTDNNWYILKTRDGFAAHTWGQSGDIPVPADYNGDGITDIVIYRPLTGQWYRILSNRGIDIRSWGEPGDIPVAADYDADGRVDIAIYRPSNVTWYIVGTSAGIFLDQFGTAEDRPTPNSFAY